MFNKCSCFKSASKVSEYAEEGKLLHKEFENCWAGIVSRDENINWAYQASLQEAQKLLEQNITEYEILTEEKISIYDKEEINEISFGTADVIINNIIIDLKNGNIRDYSLQMAMYARGLMQATIFDEVHCIVVYPRFEGVQTYKFTKEEAIKITDEVISKINEENKTPTQNEYCSWCEYFQDCTETVNKHLPGLVKQYEIEPFNYHSSQLTDPIAMGKLLTIERDIIKKWCESVEFHATEMIKTGVIPHGYKLKESKGTRKIEDVQGAYLASKLYPEQFLSACKVSLTDLRERMNIKKSEFDKFIEPFIVRGEPTISLVKE